MSLQIAAQHLASKGRHGDTTLVHMTKGEVAGLQALAQNHGTSMTINPQTGLPEAFNLRSLLPMAAGAALMIGSGGAINPLTAGMIVGGVGTLATGSLQKGLLAGLGAYGGAGLGAGLAAAGTQAAAGEVVAQEAAANQAANAATQQAATAEAVNAAQAANVGAPGVYSTPPSAYDVTSNAADMSYITPANQLPASAYNATTSASTLNADQLAAAKGNMTNMELAGKGFTNLGTEAGRNSFVSGLAPNSAGTTYDLVKYGGAAATPALMDRPEYKPPEIKGDSDMGQRYMYESGYDPSIPGRVANPSYTKVSNEEAKKYYGFAEGGVADSASSGYGAYTAQDANTAAYGLGTGINYSGYDTAPNQGISALMPTVNPNQNIVELYKEADAKRIADEAAEKAKKDAETAAANAVDTSGAGAQGGLMPRDLSYSVGGSITSLLDQLKAKGFFGDGGGGASGDTGTGYTYDASTKQYTPNMAAGGGISTLGGYSDGGRLLKGPGDGMSDNIPAKIGAKQPARLADGEFVVPADVVSHLGNGSTDAGAKQLYKMMDKIRAARTGRKAQGKQINPNKFMPA